jgi:hypothetical protein
MYNPADAKKEPTLNLEFADLGDRRHLVVDRKTVARRD